MKYGPAPRIHFFRRVALALWSKADPSVYGLVDLDVTDLTIEGSPLPYVVKATAHIMEKHKELNSILRFGRIYYRQEFNISVLVHISENDNKKSDLSYAHLKAANLMSLQEIRVQTHQSSVRIRERKDPRLHRAFALLNFLPQFLTGPFLRTFSFLVHDLNLDLQTVKLPKDPFGAVMITNVGSLGIQRALVPLVPLSRANMMISVGAITWEAKVVKGEVLPRKILPLGITFDHRFFDGGHAARMLADFEKSFVAATMPSENSPA